MLAAQRSPKLQKELQKWIDSNPKVLAAPSPYRDVQEVDPSWKLMPKETWNVHHYRFARYVFRAKVLRTIWGAAKGASGSFETLYLLSATPQ
jgi:hypothetical protein